MRCATGDRGPGPQWDNLAKGGHWQADPVRELEIKAEEPALKARGSRRATGLAQMKDKHELGVRRNQLIARERRPPRPAPGRRLLVPLTSWIPQASSDASRTACVARRPWPRARRAVPPAWFARSSRPNSSQLEIGGSLAALKRQAVSGAASPRDRRTVGRSLTGPPDRVASVKQECHAPTSPTGSWGRSRRCR